MGVLTITLPSSDYTSRDFDSWIVELRGRVNSAFPTWTDFLTPNFGNLLLEMFAQTLDVASFYQDQQFRETRVVFARLLSSMIALGKNLGFVLPGPSLATVDLTIAFADGLARAVDLIVAAGTLVATADATAVFATVAAATIPAGQIQVAGVAARNGTAQSDPFTCPGVAGFSFPLSGTPYVDGFTQVVVGVDAWAEVEGTGLYTSGPTDKVFFVTRDDQGRATLHFGDGVNGSIPSGSATAAYVVGGGASGNVEANALVVFQDGSVFPTTTGEAVTLTVRNPSGAGGGADAMTVEEARVAIPAFVRTAGQRSVTHQDFEDNARKVRGVARAMLLTSDDVNTIAENTGQLYVIPVGGGLPSGLLKTTVLNFILDSYPPTLTFALSMHDPVLLIVNVSATTFLNRNVSQADARAAVATALTRFFSLINSDGSPNELIDFGFKVRTEVMPPGSVQAVLPWSSIFAVIADATTPTGVKVFREVSRNSVIPAGDVLVPDVDFPILGSITLFDGDASVSY